MADKLILPGVGHFDAAMKRLNSSGLKEVLSEKIAVEKAPILGICLGMQVLFEQALEERVYTASQFAEAFENRAGLGGPLCRDGDFECAPAVRPGD